MGKFSTGLLCGAVLCLGAFMFDEKTMKRAKRSVKNMKHMF